MIITLTTDFGLSDPFVGIMKGVIFSIAPDAQVVDVTHEIGSHDIDEAAFVVDSSYRYFPSGTIHVVVVDPGVGGARRPIAASMGEHIFIAPDNGVLSLVLHSEPPSPVPQAYHITNERLFRHPVSQTFHGRDVFAAVAAHLARGVPLDSVGPRVADFMRRAPVKPRSNGNGGLSATVLRIDKFGNIITNLRPEHLRQDFSIHISGVEIHRLLSNYEQAETGELFAIQGSTGYIELSLRQDSAAQRLGAAPGIEIEVETDTAKH